MNALKPKRQVPRREISAASHKKAFMWLEDFLEQKIFMFDIADVRAMLEQVISGQ